MVALMSGLLIASALGILLAEVASRRQKAARDWMIYRRWGQAQDAGLIVALWGGLSGLICAGLAVVLR